MRALNGSAAAAISAGVVAPVLLIEMLLDSGPLRLNQTSLDLVVDGVTYLGTHGLGQVEEIVNRAAEMPQLAFSMSGAPSDKVSFALSEYVQGRDVNVYVALLNVDTGAVLDVSLRYSGWLNMLTLSDAADQAAITVSSEAGVRDLLRPSDVLYTHVDQQAIAPGDLAFQYTNQQLEQVIVFPAASWFVKHKN